MTSATKNWARDKDRRNAKPRDTLQMGVHFTDVESEPAVKLAMARGWKGFRIPAASMALAKSLEHFAPGTVEGAIKALDSGKVPSFTLGTGEVVRALAATDGPRVFAQPRDIEDADVLSWWIVVEDRERARSARMVGWLPVSEVRKHPLRKGRYGDQWSLRVEDLHRTSGPRYSGESNGSGKPGPDPKQLALAALERSRDACADAIGEGVWVHMTAERSEVWELREDRREGEPAHRLVKVVNHVPG